MKYPLATSTWDQNEKNAINSVIDSGMCTMNGHVSQFESNFAKYVGSKHCVMVNSGSSANLLMTAALFFTKRNALKPGDEVIVPAVSWPTTYYPLTQYGLKLRFVDIDKKTLNYDLQKLEASFTERTKLIMVVNLLGNPNDFDRVLSLARKNNVLIVEDNCESLGASFKGKMAGTFGVMGTFSTFFSHHMSTMEGGMIVTDDDELFHILLCLRAHGWTRNLPRENYVTGIKSDDPFEESFKFVLPGYNVRPLEIEGAIGIEQLKKIDSFIMMRQENAKKFKMIFDNSPYFFIQEEVGKSSWFGFALILKDSAPISRKQLANALIQAEIECRPIVAGNFAKNPVLRFMDYSIHDTLENAEFIDLNGLFIGNHHYELNKELGYLESVLKRTFSL